jgi:hypothetical protein
MFRFTIRDLMWLMVVVGLSVGWWIEHRTADARQWEEVMNVASKWAEEVGHPVQFPLKVRGVIYAYTVSPKPLPD